MSQGFWLLLVVAWVVTLWLAWSRGVAKGEKCEFTRQLRLHETQLRDRLRRAQEEELLDRIKDSVLRSGNQVSHSFRPASDSSTLSQLTLSRKGQYCIVTYSQDAGCIFVKDGRDGYVSKHTAVDVDEVVRIVTSILVN